MSNEVRRTIGHRFYPGVGANRHAVAEGLKQLGLRHDDDEVEIDRKPEEAE